MFQTASWRNSERTEIIATTEEGRTLIVPADPENADFRLITEGDAEEGIEPIAIADP